MGIFSSWSVANVTTVTFNYILVAVFLFPMKVGVSPSFHCIGVGGGGGGGGGGGRGGGEGGGRACMFMKKRGMKKEMVGS